MRSEEGQRGHKVGLTGVMQDHRTGFAKLMIPVIIFAKENLTVQNVALISARSLIYNHSSR